MNTLLDDELSLADAEALLDLLLEEEGYTPSQPQSIPPIDKTGPLPLSFAQQRLWFLDRLEPNDATYNIPAALRLGGPLKREALEQALGDLVCRHESLRTTFTAEMGQPAQIIHPAEPITIPAIDLRHLPEAGREAEAQRLAIEEAQRPFDLATGPLLRVTLLRLGDTEHLLLLMMHHIISDGWSMAILTRELAALYTVYAAGTPANLPELPIQYADFAHWQRQYLSGDLLESQLTYWRQQLDGAPPVLDLPTDHPRPPAQTFRGARQTFTLPASLAQKLKTLGRQENVTLFMTLLAAFKVLLFRYTGQTDICLGSPIANRNRTEVEGLIGFFANTLVLRTDLSGQPSFRELLQRVRTVTVGAYDHQDLPFEKLVEALQPERNLSYPSLFQVMFVLHNVAAPPATAGLHFTPITIESGTTKFDLTLEATENEEGLTCAWGYNTDLFEPTTITRLAGHFQVLLEGIVANPDQSIATLPLLTKVERQQILYEWNDTRIDYPSDCIHHLFEAQAAQSPDAIAVVFEERHLSYRELNRRANQLAHHLQSLGVGPEVLAGIYVERSLEMIVGLFGILKAGGAYVPLDPASPKERLALMLEDLQVQVLLTQEKLKPGIPLIGNPSIICLDTDWGAISQESRENPVSGVKPDNLAYVLYTTGSTGKPKGVLVEHKQVLNYSISIQERLEFTPGASFAMVQPLTVDLGITVLFPPLLTGGILHMISRDRALNPHALSAYFRRHPIDCLKIVPSHLVALQSSARPERFMPRQQLVIGGEASRWDWVRQLQLMAGGCQIFNHYGPTEATVGVLTYRVEKKQTGHSYTTTPLGRPIANTQIYLLDSRFQPVPIGVPGELFIGGANVARGYLNRPKLTGENFIPDPFSPSIPPGGGEEKGGARLYKTGDLARYLPDGNIEFLGRIDHQVKIRGFRIELGEIETVLAQHPAVQACVVSARENNPGHKRLVAYIVPNQAQIPTAELRRFLKEKLPDYMIPSAFVLLESLPLTPNGKVDRRLLPAPGSDRPEAAEIFVGPRNPAEEILAQIWAQILGLEQVGVHDNFFELGGDSILSLQIVAQANQAGMPLTSKQIFQHQTIAELAAADGVPIIQAEQGPVAGPAPLTPIQCRFFEQNLPQPHHWNQSMLLELRQPLDDALLEQAARHLLTHHDALRLRFERTGAGWRQINAAPDEAVPFSCINLSSVPEAEQQATLEAVLAELQAGLDLAKGPLLRLARIDLGPDQSGRLFIVIHHLAVDGVSWRILLEDIQTAYRQLSRGEPVALPLKTTSFKHWTEVLTKYAQSEALRQEAGCWLETAQMEIPALPLDFPADPSANTEASARAITVSVGAEDTKALLQTVPMAYQTQINDVLLTALVQTFARWTGEARVLLDLEGHGREEIVDGIDLGRTVGWFTTIFPVRLELEDASNPGDSLKAIKEQLRHIPQHGIGYGLLRYLNNDQTLAGKLHFQPQVAFNYLGQFDQTFAPDALFRPAPESVGPEHSPLGRRRHLISINGRITGGQLHVAWIYSQNFHRPETIEQLAQGFIEALRNLVAHCRSPAVSSDIPASLDSPEPRIASYVQAAAKQLPPPLELVELPAEVRQALPASIEDAYPLAAMQALMLHQYANGHQRPGAYHTQQSFHLQDGALSLSAFKEALRVLVKRHPTLRTVFMTDAHRETIQVVRKTLPFTVDEDNISHLGSAEQEAHIETLIREDRASPFDVKKAGAPLFRFRVLRRSETQFEFLMSIHHAITDGWSSVEFLNELFALYAALKRGQAVDETPAAPIYKEFVALEKEAIGSEEARNFWRNLLRPGEHQPLKQRASSTTTESTGPHTRTLGGDLAAGLQSLAQRSQVSLRTVFLSAYLDLVANETGQQVATVGLVANGRSERLSDPLKALGLFWYMVPFCQAIDRTDKTAQIKSTQKTLLDLEPYLRYPLSRMLEDRQKPELFFATLNFVHFHNTRHISAATGLQILDQKGHDKFHFPLNYVISVNPLDRQIRLRVEYDKLYFRAASISAMTDQYLTILEHLAQNGR